MTTTAVALIGSKAAEAAQTTQYTSTGVKTAIDKFTATNVTGGNVTFAVNLVNSGGAAAAANLMFSRTLAAGQCYTCPELVGHILEAGDFISTLAGAATSITIRASGRQITPS
jgi:Zn finger protein HypA/HybF involved in hydrogenase expression